MAPALVIANFEAKPSRETQRRAAGVNSESSWTMTSSGGYWSVSGFSRTLPASRQAASVV
jgi:hypothetical protein